MTQDVVIVTEAAALHVKEMIKHNEEEGAFLRVSVQAAAAAD